MEKMVTAWHHLPLVSIEKSLGSSSTIGLSIESAEKKLIEFGPNEIKETKQTSIVEVFFRQFKSILVAALLVAILFSIFTGEYVDAAVIGFVLLVNAIIGAFQEFKAEKALAAMKKLSATSARLIRGGKQLVIPAKEVVPGDVILLEVGDKVSADARIIHESNLMIDESMLTGESVPSKKTVEILPEKTLIGSMKNMLFKDTIVTGGKAKAIVVATGQNTQIGQIAGMLSETKDEAAPLQIKLDVFMKNIGVLVILGVIIVLVAGQLFLNLTLAQTIKLSIAQAVSFIPEGLPIVVTVVLAIGVTSMAKRNAIVRKLPAVETLGNVTVICTDKTGTLTKNEMTVKQIYFNEDIIEVTGDGYSTQGNFLVGGEVTSVHKEKHLLSLFKTAVLCNNAALEKKEGDTSIIGDPTEAALLVLAEKAGYIKDELEDSSPRVAEFEFDQEKKYMVTFNKEGKEIIAHAKGAPEKLLALCKYAFVNGKKVELTAGIRKQFLEENRKMASSAMRVLGLATKSVKEVSQKEIMDLTFLGLVGMIDPPREEVKASIKECKEAGIRIMMITGDHKTTAESIATYLGLMDKNSLSFTGDQLDEMNDKELSIALDHATIFARTSSMHKMRIVEALQKKGHVVAMTGDGINDALAIKKADVGIAMGKSGTEVTKESSDLILKDDNFSTIAVAVKEGRISYNNIKKVISYLIGTNLSEVLILFFILFSVLFRPEALPLVLIPIQILWINLVTDSACVITLGMEKEEDSVMKEKPRNPKEPILSTEVMSFIIWTSTIIAFWTIIVFFVDLMYFSKDLVHARTMAFSVIVLFQIFSAFNARSKKPLLYTGILSNKPLLVSGIISLLLLIIVVHIPFMNEVMGTTPLNSTDWLVVVGVSLLLPLFFEAKKSIQGILEIKRKKIIQSNSLQYAG
ncbi:MAG: HAD-IC family P-type ATPase [archaeon]|jgi:Ca2+-transporting ATPase